MRPQTQAHIGFALIRDAIIQTLEASDEPLPSKCISAQLEMTHEPDWAYHVISGAYLTLGDLGDIEDVRDEHVMGKPRLWQLR